MTLARPALTRLYGEILRLDELLTMQERALDIHDSLFFFTVHQVYELWFMVILHELEAARARMFAADAAGATYCLARVRAVERVMVEQVDTLETISPRNFADIRDRLQASSGLQSAQFREIEFISGLKDPGWMERAEVTPAERERLLRRLGEPTLWDAFLALVAARGAPDLLELMRERSDSSVLGLAEALLDHDEGFMLWRARHVLMVERIIGHKSGTGGTTGAGYLRSTLPKRFFPPLWDLRSEL
jgi:tryptophan 2,3-dioxygenase